MRQPVWLVAQKEGPIFVQNAENRGGNRKTAKFSLTKKVPYDIIETEEAEPSPISRHGKRSCRTVERNRAA